MKDEKIANGFELIGKRIDNLARILQSIDLRVGMIEKKLEEKG